MISYILALFCGVAVLIADQITKHLIITTMSLNQQKDFINGLIDLVYIHNRGGAWGIMQGKTVVLVVISVVLIAVCSFVMVKYRNNKLLFWSMSLILSGGIGNMIDRIFREGQVVDFLHFEFWPTFPIFNVADCAVVIGAGLLILYYVIDIFKEKQKNEQV